MFGLGESIDDAPHDTTTEINAFSCHRAGVLFYAAIYVQGPICKGMYCTTL
jgi:hypothetical protein